MNSTLDRFFAHYYDRAPVNATFTGVHLHDHRLPDWSAGARTADALDMRMLHAELAAAFPAPTDGAAAFLRDGRLLDAEVARANLEVRLAEHTSGHFHDRNPALWTGEAIFGAVALMIRDSAPRADRVDLLRQRLDAVVPFLAAMPAVITDPVPPRWVGRAERECVAAEGLFGAGLAMWLAEAPLPESAMAGVRAAASRARAAFADCRRWLGTVPPAELAASSAGEALYTTLLQRGHWCRQSPRDLLAEATAGMATEQARLADMLAGAGKTWDEVAAALAADRPTTAEYYPAFERRWQECRAKAAEHDAVTWPDWPIHYVPMPAWAREWAPQLYWLFYRSPAPFDPYTMHEYVVTPIDETLPPDEQERRLKAWNHSVITLNHVVHHGSVGHHVQNWHAYHQTKSRVGAIAAVDCASRIGMFLGGSMAEGWACYATELMDELGLLTPLEQLSEQHSRVRMLARAIVDIRLHLGDLPFDDAIAYYVSEVGMPAEVAAGEATKNSMFPCTAVMYWLGTSRILSLRDTVRARQGSAFSLRQFHDALLGWGALPVSLVGELLLEGLA